MNGDTSNCSLILIDKFFTTRVAQNYSCERTIRLLVLESDRAECSSQAYESAIISLSLFSHL